MQLILVALRHAARDLLAPRMLALLFWPMGIALLLWGGVAWWFGSRWQTEVAALLVRAPLDGVVRWLGAESMTGAAALVVLLLLWLPAVYLTALLITSLFLMPVVVGFVAARDYPELERRRGGTLWGGLVNSVVTLALFMAAWVLILPLWLLAPVGAALSLLLNAWLNQRMFLYDTLAEHADCCELATLRRGGGWPLYLLSAFLGTLYLVPLANLLAPLGMALAFTHYGLGRLRLARRGGPA